MKTDLFMMPRTVLMDSEKKAHSLGSVLMTTFIHSLNTDQKFLTHTLEVVMVKVLETKERICTNNARSVYGGIAYEK